MRWKGLKEGKGEEKVAIQSMDGGFIGSTSRYALFHMIQHTNPSNLLARSSSSSEKKP